MRNIINNVEADIDELMERCAEIEEFKDKAGQTQILPDTKTVKL